MPSIKERPKQVNYLNKSFPGFKNDLIEFAKTYFPQSYADFNESSPGMMFIEMAAYVGDVLSFYVDEQFRESLLAYAEEKKTVFDIAQSYGYNPTLSTPSTANVNFFQTVPATGTGENARPDFNYGYRIRPGSLVGSDEYGKTFKLVDEVNFQVSGTLDPTETSIYEVDDYNVPSKFLLKKKGRVVSGDITKDVFSFTDAIAYNKVILSNSPVLEIINVTDSDGNKWYEVESLAQDLIFEETPNTAENDPELGGYNDTTPYLLKMTRTKNRFRVKITPEGKTMMIFGSGTVSGQDEEVIPNPSNVGTNFTNSNFLNANSALDPANFLNTAVYGKAPTNTDLTVQYSYGGGIKDNVPSGTITSIKGLVTEINTSGLTAALVSDSLNSIAVNNPLPATGGRGEETLQEVKENTRQYFHAQQRAVTKEDYITRIYNMPPKYGNVSKMYIVQDDQLNEGDGAVAEELITMETVMNYEDGQGIPRSKLQSRVANPLALNLYSLGYDNSGKLAKVNDATKNNIKTYLGPYRILTDAVNIKDAYIINIAVRFSIYVKKKYNKEEIIFKCIDNVKKYFNIDKWQINQPIILADIAYEISLIEGVNNVVPPEDNNLHGSLIVVENKFDPALGYSGNIYDCGAATKQGILYPSLDPSIFELKFPNIDIIGKVVGDY
ncbi:MAG: hypothetical protein CMB80_25075 [Flammeovirgaceae bacterium]|nr:hypothetical protein [Flammeovirgaceae bacterium]